MEGELECIWHSGFFILKMIAESSGQDTKILLQYSPDQSFSPQISEAESSLSQHVSLQPDLQCSVSLSLTSNMETWNREQINEFVRKLGFLDAKEEGSERIKHFLYINEVCVITIQGIRSGIEVVKFDVTSIVPLHRPRSLLYS